MHLHTQGIKLEFSLFDALMFYLVLQLLLLQLLALLLLLRLVLQLVAVRRRLVVTVLLVALVPEAVRLVSLASIVLKSSAMVARLVTASLHTTASFQLVRRTRRSREQTLTPPVRS